MEFLFVVLSPKELLNIGVVMVRSSQMRCRSKEDASGNKYRTSTYFATYVVTKGLTTLVKEKKISMAISLVDPDDVLLHSCQHKPDDVTTK